jgi:hypothetical protein
MGMQTQDIEFMKVVVLPDGRLDARNAAAYLGLSEKTLAMFRSAGAGPPFVKLGKIFYFKDDLDEWIRSGRAPRRASAAGRQDCDDHPEGKMTNGD